MENKIYILLFIVLTIIASNIYGQDSASKINILAFYKAENDIAHTSFVNEANQWFNEMASHNNFNYSSTNQWDNLNKEFLSGYDVIIFLDARPESPNQRKAFREYMESGGGWMGFHFAGFALTPSDFPQNWNWYHDEFLGSGQYKSNTWRPTSAILKVESPDHPVTKNLPQKFNSAPNEWYQWENDLAKNSDIHILLTIDSASFPLGTGPKLHEIWHSGNYPVMWNNINYKMLYINMGHNDIDYENNTDKELSFTFKNELQNQLIINGLHWLASKTE